MNDDTMAPATDNEFEPGTGWREITEREWLLTPIDSDRVDSFIGGRQRRWIREEPVPALPTVPYTVIRVKWDERHKDDWSSVLALGVGHDWAWSPVGGPGLIDVNDLPKWITGFEVLSEPRAVTARALLEPIRDRIATHVKPGFELGPDGSEDPESAGYVAGLGSAVGILNAAIRDLGANV